MSRTRRALLIDAFTTEPYTGNPAGVVPDAADLEDDQLQRIATELGASETAFLVRTEDADADYRIRYFTPTREIALCGHATIASVAHLFETGELPSLPPSAAEESRSRLTLRTNAGEIEAHVDPGLNEVSPVVWMRQRPPTVDRVDVDYDRVSAALGIDAAALTDIGADLPIAVASTGLPFLVVPVNFLEQLGSADPNAAEIEALSEAVDAAGVYAFTFDTLSDDSTVHGRAFVPGAGVDEDPVTGTASGACAAYLETVGAFDGDPPEELRFEQGHFLDRPGTVRVRLDGETVDVGGEAVTVLDGDIVLPEPEDDDRIIEA